MPTQQEKYSTIVICFIFFQLFFYLLSSATKINKEKTQEEIEIERKAQILAPVCVSNNGVPRVSPSLTPEGASVYCDFKNISYIIDLNEKGEVFFTKAISFIESISN